MWSDGSACSSMAQRRIAGTCVMIFLMSCSSVGRQGERTAFEITKP